MLAMAARRSKERSAYHHGDLRTALIDAATELVRKDGASGFSLREAARQVGVDPAACYRHFRDRADLLLAIAQRGFERFAERMEGAVAALPDATWEKKIAAMGRVYVLFACEYPAEFRVMFGESGTTAQDPRLRLPSIRRSAYEQLEDAIRAWAHETGERTNVPRSARLAWSGVHGIARLAIDGALDLSRPEILELTEWMVKCLLRGLRADMAASGRKAR